MQLSSILSIPRFSDVALFLFPILISKDSVAAEVFHFEINGIVPDTFRRSNMKKKEKSLIIPLF